MAAIAAVFFGVAAPLIHHPVVAAEIAPAAAPVLEVGSIFGVHPAVIVGGVAMAVVVVEVVVEPHVGVVVVQAEAGEGDEPMARYQNPGGVDDVPQVDVGDDKHPSTDDDEVELLIGMHPVVDGAPIRADQGQGSRVVVFVAQVAVVVTIS